jgi:hypothetical protein
MNLQRRRAALAKLSTPTAGQVYPLPPPHKRQALTAAFVIQPVESRLARAQGVAGA